MNPYEAPQAQADKQPRDTMARPFLIDIVTAGAIYFVTSLFVPRVLIPFVEPPYVATWQEMFSCMMGAIYMGFATTRQGAYLVQGSWRKNGVVYSLIIAALAFNVILMYGEILVALFGWLLRSTIITLFTMYFVRLIVLKQPPVK